MSVKIVRVASYKYPDSPRYFYPTALISEEKDHVVLFQPVGMPFWSHRDESLHRGNGHALNLLYFDRDYNISIFWKADWTFGSYYVNVALPTEWDGELCSYVDLDLDVIWRTDDSYRVLSGTESAGVYVEDRDEYEERKVSLNYPIEIMDRCEAAVEEVLSLIEKRVYPFDHSLLNWRPSQEIMQLAELPDSAALWHL